MKTLLVAVGLTLVASEASAISRYQTKSMTCAQVQSVLRQEGAAILRWQSKRDSSLPIYGKYVSSVRYCEFGEETTFASVPTVDDQGCDVRRCQRPDNDRRFRWMPRP